jgi:hypothetical protein
VETAGTVFFTSVDGNGYALDAADGKSSATCTR